ncbi:hypothetical protein Y032_0040g267 [Ancylostoma ceylanicum]|nr:hypothetical protein Y032_0040g267 [Ancylostoma ceylanicum]
MPLIISCWSLLYLLYMRLNAHVTAHIRAPQIRNDEDEFLMGRPSVRRSPNCRRKFKLERIPDYLRETVDWIIGYVTIVVLCVLGNSSFFTTSSHFFCTVVAVVICI